MSPKYTYYTSFSFTALSLFFVSGTVVVSSQFFVVPGAENDFTLVPITGGRHDASLKASIINPSQEANLLAMHSNPLSSVNIAIGGSDETPPSSDEWRQAVLSREALQRVLEESRESTNRILEMRSNLESIHEQLKTAKVTLIDGKLRSLALERTQAENKKNAFLSQITTLDRLELMVKNVTQDAQDKKNTDLRLYKRIQEYELQLSLITDQLTTDERPSDDGLGTIPFTDLERTFAKEKKVYLTRLLSLLRTGIPEEQSAAILKAEDALFSLDFHRDDVEKNIARIDAQLTEMQRGEDLLRNERDVALQKPFVFTVPSTFVWPVHGTLTAGFLDPDYHTVFGVSHRAIDLAVPQSTPVVSIADGIVYSVRDGGKTGYSYVLIGHSSGYASLYGHVSQFLVKPGETVTIGQPIALSGGTPGTHGAGHMTTGAHLHLEIMKDGVHVNPLSVLR